MATESFETDAWLAVSDIQVFVPGVEPVLAQALIDGAVARALVIAPCLASPTANHAAAKAIVRDVVLRRVEAGAGALSTQTAGPFSQSFDTRTSPRVMFFPAEIDELQRLCQDHPDVEADTAHPRYNMPPSPSDVDRAPGARRLARTYYR